MDPRDAHLIGPRPKTVRCARCRQRFAIKPLGRIPEFCSRACKQAAFEKLHRLRRKPGPSLPLAEQVALRVWQALIDAQVIAPGTPMPPPREAEQR